MCESHFQIEADHWADSGFGLSCSTEKPVHSSIDSTLKPSVSSIFSDALSSATVSTTFVKQINPILTGIHANVEPTVSHTSEPTISAPLANQLDYRIAFHLKMQKEVALQIQSQTSSTLRPIRVRVPAHRRSHQPYPHSVPPASAYSRPNNSSGQCPPLDLTSSQRSGLGASLAQETDSNANASSTSQYLWPFRSLVLHKMKRIGSQFDQFVPPNVSLLDCECASRAHTFPPELLVVAAALDEHALEKEGETKHS